MNLNFKILTVLLTFGFIGISAFLTSAEDIKNNTEHLKSNFNEEDIKRFDEKKYLETYRETIEYIKKHEGFIAYPYYDVAGIKTIGYGHVITDSDSFPDTISRAFAEKILIKDFNMAIKSIERETDLKGNKKLAMAHFVFMMGIGNFLKSRLPKLIKNGKPINTELENWCYYRNPNGKMIRSDYSYRIRLWEIEMYNK